MQSVIISATGVMMFFSLYKREVDAMHEWLGLAFVIAVAFHLARHRKSLVAMLSQNRMRIPMLLTGVIAAGFLAFPSSNEGNPMKLLKAVVSDAKSTQITH